MKKPKKEDVTYAIAKAGIASIPIVGAPASELFQLLVTPPLEQRRNAWMKDIGERLANLEMEGKIDLPQLARNEIFIDVIVQTVQQAIKTSQEEKLAYYRNVVTNTALGEHPDISEIQIFLNLISDYTVWHIKILKLFDDIPKWYNENNKQVPSIMGGLSSILENAFPELKGRSDFYNLIWNDLQRAGFHSSGSLQTIMTSQGLIASRTSEYGKRFLEFISSE
jgi:hypothetical protein